jgi:predicted TIM-barrel fold metal-dependent hydrolase
MSAATMLERAEIPAQRTQFIDCDIHPTPKSPQALHPWLARNWQEHLATYGGSGHGPTATAHPYPLYAPATSRRDAWPPGGGLPGSDLAFMQAQHLDPNGVEVGVLLPLFGASSSRNQQLSAAVAHAINQWQVATFTSQDRRLRASIQVPYDDTAAAVAEIERWAGHPDFVQVQFGSSTSEPLGRPRYWPVFDAAQRAGLPIGIHVGGSSGFPRTGAGWASFYVEAHYDLIHGMQTQVASLILEGALERYPDLRFVLVEGGFAWAPSLAWRLDRLWARMRDEVPNCKRPPSEYMKRHFWFTTQPIEEPEHPEDLLLTFEQIGWDRILFATDYPHWDFDDPKYAIKVQVSDHHRRMLFRDNATALYGFEPPVPRAP